MKSNKTLLIMPFVCTLLAAQPYHAIRGNAHPDASQQFDKGPVGTEMKLDMSLMLAPTAAQTADLDNLLEQQQNPGSPLFRQWLTPEQFADRFGATRDDIARVTDWLQASGFTVIAPARGRDFISFSGTAGQVERAFHTSIHRYEVRGEKHFANADEPSIPAQFAGVVAGVRGFHDFRPKSFRRAGLPPVKLKPGVMKPEFYTQMYPGVNLLAPDDLAAIYDVNGLYKAGIDGTGQSLVIAGVSAIDLDDIRAFQSIFNLPPRDPQVVLVPGSQDPGMNDAMGEADLDLEWSGAIARNASIVYVYAADPFDATFYAIDQAIAPVISFSFGLCEMHMSQNDVALVTAEAKKGAVEGITWLVASGDSGASGCENQNGGFNTAITRMSVSFPASIPYVTAVGGTEFAEGNGNYWSAVPGPNGGTALGYIPESVWNDELVYIQNGYPGFASGGGGSSLWFTKPSWQTGAGVPNDGVRDVPDVALTASWFHDPYTLISGGSFGPNGGTSAATPTFAGMVVLLNQYLGTQGLGNINPTLYQLAKSGALHDVSLGSNDVPCFTNSSQDCTTGVMGYSAGAGYDRASGLGSVDAFALAQNWKNGATNAQPSAHLVITHFTASTMAKVGGSINVSWTVANQGNLAAAATFQTRMFFTTDGDPTTPNEVYVYCTVYGLPVGASSTCSGSAKFTASIVAGVYQLVAVADPLHTIPQTDASGGTAQASTGPLTVTK
jgi:subtilase family serine protease